MWFLLSLMTAAGLGDAAALDKKQASSSSVPQIFQTSPQIYAGPTKTGHAPFLAQTNSAPTVHSSGKSSYSVDTEGSEGKRKEKVDAKSEVRVYGRGE